MMAGSGRYAPRYKDLKLPLSRIKTIMKSSPEVENIGQDALFLVAKSTELFIQYLAKSAYDQVKCDAELHYKNIAEVVQTDEVLAFCREIMPRQITFGQYKELMKQKGINIEEMGSEDSDSSSSSSGSESVDVQR